jgi:polyhydroxybutyrate depolymerase
LTHNNRARSAIVHVPLRAGDAFRLPVVFNFHGGGTHGAHQQDFSLMDRAADRHNFMVVYPNGTGRLQTRVLTWNAGSCCGYAASEQVDDVGFTVALLKQLSELAPIERSRVYATGMSNGAMMVYRLASEAAEYFAAVAPVAGGMVVQTIKARRAVPIMHFHSVDDPRALYGGGLGRPFPLTKNSVLHPNVDAVIAKWVDHNGCSTEAKVAPAAPEKYRQGHTARRYVYGSCRDGAEVVLWKLTGAGHVWPGGQQKVPERLLGPSTKVTDANSEMWNFFSRFTL